ncbi:MAG: hypothetical protein KBB21_37510, partial [Nannocystaceae bacterium]|nr:hypothetical protein [Nannocystaceae bacterium]
PGPPPEVAMPSRLPARLHAIAPAVQPGLVAFAATLPDDARVWMGRLSGNGGRDVVIYVPPGARDDAPFELVYHFHGTHSEHVQAKAPGLAKKRWVGWDRLQQSIDAIGDLQRKRGHNVALVYPFSAGKRREPGLSGWWNKEYDRMWMASDGTPSYSDDFDTMHGEVVEILRTQFGVHDSKLPKQVLVEGHSAGGIALFNIARQDTAVVGEYLFLDASFQGWADGCWREIGAHKRSAKVSMVVTINGIADAFGKPDPWCTRLREDAAAWAELGGRACKGSIGGRPCDELETSANEWPDYRAWCEALAGEMKDLPGVYLLRTKVPHGKQPRHFVGALELPDDRD